MCEALASEVCSSQAEHGGEHCELCSADERSAVRVGSIDVINALDTGPKNATAMVAVIVK